MVAREARFVPKPSDRQKMGIGLGEQQEPTPRSLLKTLSALCSLLSALCSALSNLQETRPFPSGKVPLLSSFLRLGSLYFAMILLDRKCILEPEPDLEAFAQSLTTSDLLTWQFHSV